MRKNDEERESFFAHSYIPGLDERDYVLFADDHLLGGLAAP